MRAATTTSKASTVRHTGQRIVFTTLGSLGDLYPYLALALGMRARGYQAVVATSPCYRQRVEAAGVPFLPLRPDSDWVADPDRMGRYMHPRWGTFRVLREQVLPALPQSYEDTQAAADGADLLVSHPIAYATRLVAEKRGIRWASSLPFPIGIFSAHDPPLLPGTPPGLSRALLPGAFLLEAAEPAAQTGDVPLGRTVVPTAARDRPARGARSQPFGGGTGTPPRRSDLRAAGAGCPREDASGGRGPYRLRRPGSPAPKTQAGMHP